MATTTNPPRGLDSELTHIVTELFSNNHGIKSSLKANNINSRMDLHDALSKPELMKHVRWKNGDPKNGEVIMSDVYRELILVPSFVNWLQNNHGTLPDCPIDFEHQVTRSKFTMFLLLDNYGRRGQHGDGTVSYDHTIAHESEKRHKRGAYAPSISVSPAAASITAVASSVGPPASSVTTSAGINTTPTTTAGNNNNTTAAPQASITGNNPSSAVQGGNNNPPPTVQVPPTAPPQAVPTRESQSKMATSVSSCEVDDSNVRDTSFIVSDPYLDIDDCSDSTEDGTSFAPETICGFRDFKEEFDFKVRSRWRRPCTHITGLFEEHVPTTTNRIVAMNMGNAENLQEYDSGLSMDQVTNYHVSVGHSTDTSGLIDRRVNSGLAKLAANGCITYDHPQILRGEQCLATVDKWLLTGHRIQLDFENGLSYIKMQYPIEKDMRLYHVIMTGEVAWNPTKYNKKLSSAVRDFNPAGTSSDLDVLHPSFDQFGELITARYGELGPEEMEATVDLLSVSIRYQRRVDTTGEMFSVVKDPIHCAFHMEFNAEMYADMYQSCALLGNIDVHYTSQTSAPVGYQDTRKYFLYEPVSTVVGYLLFDGTISSQVVDKGMMFFSCHDELILALTDYLLQPWGVLVIFIVGFILLHCLLRWTQHVFHDYDHPVTKVHVVWGGVLQSTYALVKKMETLVTSATSLGAFQDEDESSTAGTHKFKKIALCMIISHMSIHVFTITRPVLRCSHMSIDIFVRQVLRSLVQYYPSCIQGYQFAGIDPILLHFYKSCDMIYYFSTALVVLLECHKMIGEYFPMKMRCFINLEESPFSLVNGEQSSFETNGEQILSREYLPATMRRFCHLLGAHLHDLVLPNFGLLQDFASQFCSDPIYIALACKLHLHHPSLVEITQEHLQHHILLRCIFTNQILKNLSLCMITSEEYGETPTTLLRHATCLSEGTLLCELNILLVLFGIATAENATSLLSSRVGNEKPTSILCSHVGYGDIMWLIGKDTISASTSSDTCTLSLAHYASQIDGELNSYALRDLVRSDLLHDLLRCKTYLCVCFNYGELQRCTTIQELLAVLHNFTRRFSFGSSDFFRCDIFRCNLFDGFYFDDFVESAGSPAEEIFFVRTPVGYAQLQLHYQVMDAIYLELQVTNNRPVKTIFWEGLSHMVTTFAGWGVSREDENEISGIRNAPSFAPYLEMIIFRIWRIGVLTWP